MIKYILSGILIAFIILFASLTSVWTGFSYFALSFGCAISLIWTIIWLIEYFITYKRENLQERYNLYCAVIVNSSAMSLDIIQKSDKIFYKKFKRTLIKEKLIFWLRIFFSFGLFIGLLFAMFLWNIENIRKTSRNITV